jgi:hypothetical protein
MWFESYVGHTLHHERVAFRELLHRLRDLVEFFGELLEVFAFDRSHERVDEHLLELLRDFFVPATGRYEFLEGSFLTGEGNDSPQCFDYCHAFAGACFEEAEKLVFATKETLKGDHRLVRSSSTRYV